MADAERAAVVTELLHKFADNACEQVQTSHPKRPQTILRMGARVVERARLESVCALNGTEGSNPSPSATSRTFVEAYTFRVRLAACRNESAEDRFSAQTRHVKLVQC